MHRENTTPLIKTDENADGSAMIVDLHMSAGIGSQFQKPDTVLTNVTGFECVDVAVRAAT